MTPEEIEYLKAEVRARRLCGRLSARLLEKNDALLKQIEQLQQEIKNLRSAAAAGNAWKEEALRLREHLYPRQRPDQGSSDAVQQARRQDDS